MDGSRGANRAGGSEAGRGAGRLASRRPAQAQRQAGVSDSTARRANPPICTGSPGGFRPGQALCACSLLSDTVQPTSLCRPSAA